MTEQEIGRWQRPRFWIWLLGVIILLIFLYFYQPFEAYLAAHIPQIRLSNVIFWFASLVAVIAYAIAHWQSFRQHIFRGRERLDAEALVFDSLQVAILTAVIFSAGATLQAVGMLGEHLMNRGPILDSTFGGKLLTIILLVILAILFYLLHHLVRALRLGWSPKRAPPRSAGPG